MLSIICGHYLISKQDGVHVKCTHVSYYSCNTCTSIITTSLFTIIIISSLLLHHCYRQYLLLNAQNVRNAFICL